MIYLDGFAVTVPAGNKAACFKHAAEMAEVLKESGGFQIATET